MLVARGEFFKQEPQESTTELQVPPKPGIKVSALVIDDKKANGRLRNV